MGNCGRAPANAPLPPEGETELKVLFLTRYNEVGASSRCRVYQYLPFLEKQGIAGEVAPRLPPARELWRRAAGVDRVFLQKRLPTLAVLLGLRRQAQALLFDFDDAIWLRRRRDHSVCPASVKTRLRLAATLRLSDQVIAGNDYLAAYARRWNPRVAVLPTPVDGEYYASGQWSVVSGQLADDALATAGWPLTTDHGSLATDPWPRPPGVSLGWIGHPTNLHYLRTLEPAFEALCCRYPNLSLRVICSEPFESGAIPVENVPWSLADEVSQLHRLDIGLMPLEDDPWTRGKCAYKALQYMAAKKPVVCSPVGMNNEVVTEGKTGLLATDLPSWERQIGRLLDSASLRQQIGEAGQQAVLQRFSLDLMAPLLADLLRSTVRGGRGSR